ncbi:hypothetical protein WN943_011581 [Citrus x changshan-huyou]
MGDVFIDVGHFRQVLHEFVNGGRLNERNGFWLRGYHKKHECRLTKQSVKVASTWIAEMIEGHVAIDPNVKISLLKTYMQEKFILKIEKLTMFRAREKARILVYDANKEIVPLALSVCEIENTEI